MAPHGTHFARDIETRNHFAVGVQNLALDVAARTALRVEKRGNEFDRVERAFQRSGENRTLGVLHRTTQGVLAFGHALVPFGDGGLEAFRVDADRLGEFFGRAARLDETGLQFNGVVLRPDIAFAVAEPAGDAARHGAGLQRLFVEDQVGRDARIAVLDRIKEVNGVEAGVRVDRFFVHEALAVLVNPEARGRHVARRNGLLARNDRAERAGVGGHVPELGADGLRHLDAVARVAWAAERVDLHALGEVREHFGRIFVAAAGENHGLLGAVVLEDAFLAGLDAHDATAVNDETNSRRVVADGDLAQIHDGVVVHRKEGGTRGKFLPHEGVLVDRVGVRKRRKARSAVAAHAGAFGHAEEESALLDDLVDEGAKEFLIHFAARVLEGLRQVFVGLLLVLRDHDAARAHGGVAAARFELFENQHPGARVVRFNGGRGARTAEARDQDVGFFFPLEVRNGFLGDRMTAENRRGGRQKAFGKCSSLHDVSSS